MNKRGQGLPPLKIMFVAIIVIVILFGGGQIWSSFKAAQAINEQSAEISNSLETMNNYLTDLNTKLAGLNELPSKIEDIQNKITALETKTNEISLDSSSYNAIKLDLEEDIKQLEELKQGLEELEKELEELQDVYPPVQTQNLIFQNSTEEAVNTAITNAIQVNSTKLTISFAFGALFGSLFSVSIYFIFKRYIIKKED